MKDGHGQRRNPLHFEVLILDLYMLIMCRIAILYNVKVSNNELSVEVIFWQFWALIEQFFFFFLKRPIVCQVNLFGSSSLWSVLSSPTPSPA